MRKCKAMIFENREQVPVEGLFHRWAQQYEDCGDAGIGNYTVAIIELDDGRVVEANPDTVVFLDRVPGVEPVTPNGTWWMRRPEPVVKFGADCMNCGRPCKKTYPFSTFACPNWISREGMFRVSVTETGEQKSGEAGK